MGWLLHSTPHIAMGLPLQGSLNAFGAKAPGVAFAGTDPGPGSEKAVAAGVAGSTGSCVSADQAACLQREKIRENNEATFLDLESC